MWYLNEHDQNTSMGIQQVWRWNYSGEGVSIAIVDNGVDYQHKDLADRMDHINSHDYIDDDDDPQPEGLESHGTSCAGIALASANDYCVIGVAYNAKLIAQRIVKRYSNHDLTQGSYISQAFLNTAVHVSSNSWGAGHAFDGPSRQVQQSLKHGVSTNRRGKGVVYIFASGNLGSQGDCNIDGYVNSIYTIGVNAVTEDNRAPAYISPCSAVMVSAYSGNNNSVDVCTTTPGGRCTDRFIGTSAATPMVAGAVALLLEANPRLHWRDVQELLVRTSKTNILKSEDFRTNAVGRRVSDLFGYGLIDVATLITVGKDWKNLDEQHICSSDFIAANTDDGDILQSIITTNGCNKTSSCVNSLEHVQAIVVFKYTSRPVLEIKLQSPSGFVSTLFNDIDFDKNITSGQNWTYMSVQHWGEDPAGSWVLSVSMKPNQSNDATFVGWKLILFGTGDECTETEVDNSTRRTPNIDSGSSSYTAIGIIVPLVVIIAFSVSFGIFYKMKYRRNEHVYQDTKYAAASSENQPMNNVSES